VARRTSRPLLASCLNLGIGDLRGLSPKAVDLPFAPRQRARIGLRVPVRCRVGLSLLFIAGFTVRAIEQRLPFRFLRPALARADQFPQFGNAGPPHAIGSLGFLAFRVEFDLRNLDGLFRFLDLAEKLGDFFQALPFRDAFLFAHPTSISVEDTLPFHAVESSVDFQQRVLGAPNLVAQGIA